MGDLEKTISDAQIKFFEAGGQNLEFFWDFSLSELNRFYRGYRLRTINQNFNNLNLVQNIALLFSKNADRQFKKEVSTLSEEYSNLTDSEFDEITHNEMQKLKVKKQKELEKAMQDIEIKMMNQKLK